MKAVAVENVDKMVAAGQHYASGQYLTQLPAIPGFDGVGTLPDGTVVGSGQARAPYGALAEQTVVAADHVVPIPAGLDPVTAVVLATAVTGMSIKTAAAFVPGETVLIQGATGVAGRLAVKVARLLEAGRIVATGRDAGALREVRALGADTVINAAVPDDALAVPDRRRGQPADLRGRALRRGQGPDPAVMAEVYGQIVRWAQDGTLTFEAEKVPLSEIEAAWRRPGPRGSRLVVVP